MEYIRVENNIIVELVSCSECPGPEWQEVDLEGGLAVGDDVRAFDENWALRPLNDLIAEGVVKPKSKAKPELEPEPEDPAMAIRNVRDSKLIELDRVVTNPLRWEAMSDELKKSYAEYRQALLNVPQQESFPKNIKWPTPPE